MKRFATHKTASWDRESDRENDMSLLLRKVGRDDKMMNVEGKEEKTSKRARVHEDLEPQIESSKTKRRKKDKRTNTW